MIFAFEGIDCVGKTLAIHTIAKKLKEKGFTVYVKSDWDNCQELKRRLLQNDDIVMRIDAVIKARNKQKSFLLREGFKNNVVILYDRYLWSTIVYQTIATVIGGEVVFHNKLLNKVLSDGIVDYTTVYIKPSEGYLKDFRHKFLYDRGEINEFDKQDYCTWLETYDCLIRDKKHTFLGNKPIVIENDGTERFFDNLDKFCKGIGYEN